MLSIFVLEILLFLSGKFGSMATISLLGIDQDISMCDIATSLSVSDALPGWSCIDNNPITPVCMSYIPMWEGVTCDYSGDVVAIDLENLGLTGSIPSSIGGLNALMSLKLENNNIFGTIPTEIGMLVNLLYFDISHNFCYGPIPPSIGLLTNLLYLSVGYNGFSGPLPSSLGSLHSLMVLDVYYGRLSGSIPSSIGYMSNLNTLVLAFNQFVGTIPHSVGMLSGLQTLAISGNPITGPLPSSVTNLTNLHSIIIVMNAITGTIPFHIGLLSKLTQLEIYGNQLSGTIPWSIGGLSNLVNFDAFGNRLSGSIPDSIGLLSSCGQLALFDNHLTGSIPESIGRLTNMHVLALFNNSITGSIPTSIGYLASLQLIVLLSNCITGPIPSSIGLLTNITAFAVGLNSITGEIPHQFWNLKKMQYLGLNDNLLVGTIPSMLGTLTDIILTDISRNPLKGTIPSSLGLLENALLLIMNDIAATGTIPSSLGNLQSIQHLFIDINQLVGTVPDSLLSLSTLVSLRLDRNYLSGTIPSLQKLTVLRYVCLNDNKFVGSITAVSVNSSQLTFFDASNNQLTGTIPVEIFKLSSLTLFAAASNCLEVILPREFCNAINLNVLALDGMHTQCTTKFFKNLPPNTYPLSTSRRTGVPACLYNMTGLRVLHLSGNALTGTLPAHSPVSPALQDLSLSHNLLEGSIPTQFQERHWEKLDLSYNKLSGTLTDDISVGDSTLILTVNRLSGKIPSAVHSLSNIAILSGNLFQCNDRPSVLPEHDSERSLYKCGSDALEIAFYIWMVVISVSALIGVAILLKYSELRNVIRYVWDFHCQSTNLSPLDMLAGKTRVICTILTCLILVFLLPTYGSLGSYYRTHEYRYGWAISAVYMSGEPAAIVLLVLWTMLMTTFVCLMSTQLTDSVIPRPPVVKLRAGRYRGVAKWVAALSLGFLNTVVMLTLNGAYVYLSLTLSTLQSIFAQIVVGVLKAFWSIAFVENVDQVIHTVSPTSVHDSFDTMVVTVILILNNIAFPGIAESAADPNCFYNMIVTPKFVRESYYMYGLCLQTITSDNISYCVSFSQYIRTKYIPPFIYSYQCSSVMISNYVSVFVYMFLSISLCGPVSAIIFKRYGVVTISSILGCRQAPLELKLGVRKYSAFLLCYVTILMTYGVAYPPLSVLICVAVWIDTNATQYMVATKVLVCEGEFKQLNNVSMLLLLLLISSFYALFLFDITGDKIGVIGALWAPLTMLAIPFVLIVFRYFRFIWGPMTTATDAAVVDVSVTHIGSTDVALSFNSVVV